MIFVVSKQWLLLQLKKPKAAYMIEGKLYVLGVAVVRSCVQLGGIGGMSVPVLTRVLCK